MKDKTKRKTVGNEAKEKKTEKAKDGGKEGRNKWKGQKRKKPEESHKTNTNWVKQNWDETADEVRLG